jgi:hypothetical protein
LTTNRSCEAESSAKSRPAVTDVATRVDQELFELLDQSAIEFGFGMGRRKRLLITSAAGCNSLSGAESFAGRMSVRSIRALFFCRSSPRLARSIQKDVDAAREVIEALVHAGLVEAHGVKKGRTYTLSRRSIREWGSQPITSGRQVSTLFSRSR